MNRFCLAVAALGLCASAAVAETISGSGRTVAQDRPARDFSGISIGIPARVEVVQGSAEGVRISADDNVLPAIETVVERGVLRMRLREGVQLRKATIRVTVNARSVESIGISGSADVHAPSLTTARLGLSISGSGDMRVGGKADEVDVRISGSGDVKAAQLATQRASVSISGSGDATVWAREALRVRVAGSGDVAYYGDPQVQKSVAGSGSVRRLGATPS